MAQRRAKVFVFMRITQNPTNLFLHGNTMLRPILSVYKSSLDKDVFFFFLI